MSNQAQLNGALATGYKPKSEMRVIFPRRATLIRRSTRVVRILPATVAILCVGFFGPLRAEEWRRHVIDDSSRGADGVRLADVNGDGRLDVVTPWEEGGDVRVAFDQGLRAQQRWDTKSIGRVRSVEDAFAVDLDRDGHLEVVACAEGKEKVVRVFTNQEGVGGWKAADLGHSRGRQQYMFALPMDFEAAGRTLIVGAKNANATISEWRSPKSDRGNDSNAADFGNWVERELCPAGWIMSLQAADIDGDGIDDLIYTDRKGSRRGVWWIRGSANGLVGPPHLIGGDEHEVMFLTIADLDGDGDRDIAVASRPQLLLLFERRSQDGTDWKMRSFSLPANAGLGKGVAVETEHGPTEIFVTSGPLKGQDRLSIVRFVWDDPASVMVSPPDLTDAPGGTTGIKFDRVELLDLDGDGDRDLLTCEERANLGVVWYERPGRPIQSDDRF